MKPYFLSLILVVGSIRLSAQVSDVRGVVSDSSSGEKVPFVSVIIKELNRGTATNLNGFYLLSNIPAGEYTLLASSVGFRKFSHRIVVKGGEPTIFNIPLPPEPVEFSEVVVTDRAKRDLSEINTSVHVLDPRDIKVVPVVLQEDVFRAVQILPGVVSTSDVNSHFYVRGGGADQNLILLDGMKIYSPFHAFGIFSTFDADVIKSTEVYTGAYPPGFGGRLSSVVNLTTRDGRSNELSGKANLNFVSGKLQLEGPVMQDFTWLFSGRKSLFGNSISQAFHKDMPVSFYDSFVKVIREEPESNGRLGFEGFYTGDKLTSSNPQDPDYAWNSHAIGIVASGLVQDRLFVDAVGFDTYFEAARDPKQSNTSTPTSTKVRESGVRANATLYTDTHDLYFFGFEFDFPSMEYNLINSFGMERGLTGSTAEVWTWLRYQATLHRWKVDGGIHVDVGSLFTRQAGMEVMQPRLNVSYALDEDWKLKFSYGRFSQQFITVNNEDDAISIFDGWIIVPDDLKPEGATHYVVGIDGHVLPSLSTSVQVYYKDFNALVTYNRDKVDARDPDYINSKGKAYGLELLLRFGTPAFDFYGACTLSKTSIHYNGFEYLPKYDRRLNLNLLGVWHATQRFDATLRWEFGSGFPYSETVGYYDRLTLQNVFGGTFVNETGSPYLRLGDKNAARLPSYHRLDASINYRFALSNFVLITASRPVRGAVGISVINVYDHQNLFYFDRRSGQEVGMLSFFPSLTLNLEF